MTFNTNPLNKADLEVIAETFGSDTAIPDWAESLTLIRVNLRKLDDAFPASDEQKVVAAFAGLCEGVDGLQQFLSFRGVKTIV
jgi:hypothetical protein